LEPFLGSSRNFTESRPFHQAVDDKLPAFSTRSRLNAPQKLLRFARSSVEPKLFGVDGRTTTALGQTFERGLLRFEAFAVRAVLFDQNGAFVGRLSADAEPVSDAFVLENDAGVRFRNHRVIVTEFFQNATVARATSVDGDNAEKRAVLATELLHTNFNSHLKLLRQKVFCYFFSESFAY
jgi:hypothetical protein